jgi:hypothetical protein
MYGYKTPIVENQEWQMWYQAGQKEWTWNDKRQRISENSKTKNLPVQKVSFSYSELLLFLVTPVPIIFL